MMETHPDWVSAPDRAHFGEGWWSIYGPTLRNGDRVSDEEMGRIVAEAEAADRAWLNSIDNPANHSTVFTYNAEQIPFEWFYEAQRIENPWCNGRYAFASIVWGLILMLVWSLSI
jgi:hypothetical protein